MNLSFTVIFFLEMLIKLLGFGVKGYFQDNFNTFDCIIVVMSLLDLTLTYSPATSGFSSSAIQAMRAFRLLRIFKLAKSWTTFQDLLRTIQRTFSDIRDFSILLCLFMFIYCLLGLEFFAYKLKFNDDGNYDPNGRSPPSNFDTFLDSFASVFIVLANDFWSPIFYYCYRSHQEVISLIFFISLLIFGQFILLNLFLAILLQNFDEDSIDQELRENKRKMIFGKQKQSKCMNLTKKYCCCFKYEDDNLNNRKKRNLSTFFKALKKKPVENIEIKPVPQKNALIFLGPQNKFRNMMFDLANHQKFQNCIILVIIFSSVILAIENPLNDPDSDLVYALYVVDIITTSIFVIEAVIKIIAFGFFFNGDSSYLQNLWNFLDFIIVLVSIISLASTNTNLNFFKVLRLLRILRPLRMISRNQGLKIAVAALFKALPNIINVTIISLLFFLIFGIIAVNYFKGNFFTCEEIDGIHSASINGEINKWECVNLGGEWAKFHFTFDNISASTMTLFHMATTVGWAEVMYRGIRKGDQDSYKTNGESNKAWIFFFIFFIIYGTFFILNLFVGIVIATFNREKERLGKNFLLTDQQKEWLSMKLVIMSSKPKKIVLNHSSKIRQLALKITYSPSFDNFIMSLIILNTVVLMIKWYDEPEIVKRTTDIINYSLAGVFTVEAIIKIFALGSFYFSDGWNVFDFFIVILTIVGIILTLTIEIQVGPAATIARAFKIFRIFRLVKRAKSLRMMFQTFVVSLPALINIGGLLVLLLYVYAVLGINLFANVKRNGMLDNFANFQTLGSSLLTLIRIATGENWHEILYALTRNYSMKYQCIEDPTYEDYKAATDAYNEIPANKNTDDGLGITVGCGNQAAYFYFISYLVIVQLVFLNLFIAIILQGFEDINSSEARILNSDVTSIFKEKWSKYDPKGTSKIPVEKLEDLLLDLGPPLGWPDSIRNDKAKQQAIIKNLNLIKYDNLTVYKFNEVLESLTLNVFIQQHLIEETKKEQGVNDLIKSEQANSPVKKKVSPVRKIKTIMEEDFHDDESVRQQFSCVKLQFIRDFKKIKERKDEIQIVNQVVQKEEKLKKMRIDDTTFSSLHYDAARLILKYYRAKKLKQLGALAFQRRGSRIHSVVEEAGSRGLFKGFSTQKKSTDKPENEMNEIKEKESKESLVSSQKSQEVLKSESQIKSENSERREQISKSNQSAAQDIFYPQPVGVSESHSKTSSKIATISNRVASRVHSSHQRHAISDNSHESVMVEIQEDSSQQLQQRQSNTESEMGKHQAPVGIGIEPEPENLFEGSKNQQEMSAEELIRAEQERLGLAEERKENDIEQLVISAHSSEEYSEYIRKHSLELEFQANSYKSIESSLKIE